MKRLAAFLLAGLMALASLGLAEETVTPEPTEKIETAAAGETASVQEEPEATAWYDELYMDTDEQEMETPVPKATPTAAVTTDPETGEAATTETAESAGAVIDDGTETEVVDGEPYQLTEDPENGRWEYHSASLNIVIERVKEKVKVGKKTRTREYCIADIQASPEAPLYPVMTEATKKPEKPGEEIPSDVRPERRSLRHPAAEI